MKKGREGNERRGEKRKAARWVEEGEEGEEEVSGCKQHLTACERGVMTLIKYQPAFTLAVARLSFVCHVSFLNFLPSRRSHTATKLPPRADSNRRRSDAVVSAHLRLEFVLISCLSASSFNPAVLDLSRVSNQVEETRAYETKHVLLSQDVHVCARCLQACVCVRRHTQSPQL